MNLLDIVSDAAAREQWHGRRYGVVIGIVTDIQDPDGLGRIKVKFPWLADDQQSNWARIAAPKAGKDRGISFLPEVEDEVLVAFEHGDPRAPYVLGALWNAQDTPPEEKSGDSNNDRMVIKSRSGHLIVLDDASGAEKIQITDSTGKNKITIESASNKIAIEVDGDIELKAPSGKIVLDAQSVEVHSSAGTKVAADAGLELTASGTTTVKGATVNIN